jgi:Protein of unknown function (DUF4242)
LGTYVVIRRRAWRTIEDLRESAKRAESALEWAPDEIRWLCSYVLAESDGAVGMVCIYQATSPEAIRTHARRARLPVDEIVALAETLVVDPVGTAA